MKYHCGFMLCIYPEKKHCPHRKPSGKGFDYCTWTCQYDESDHCKLLLEKGHTGAESECIEVCKFECQILRNDIASRWY